MRSTLLLLSALAATSLAAPNPPEKRQGNLAELLNLASYAGITALPTNPTALLQLGQAAGPLESALPTAPVLSVLETAAPKNFISDILYNPGYASSFESAFAAGSSPSWFNGLPTDVKSYLHTYSGFGNLAAGAAALNSGLASANASAAGVVSTTTSSGSVSASTGSGAAGAASAGSGSMSMTSMASMTSSGSMATPTGGSSTGGAAAAGQSSASASAQTGGASRPDGAVAAGLAGVVGILGLALGL